MRRSRLVYVAFDVADGEAEAALDAMRMLGIAGLSVTMPHKTDVAQLSTVSTRLRSVCSRSTP